jgi:xanthine phosphoribosyltransferase
MNLSWKDIDILCESLSQKIRQSGIKYEFIYGVPRGGLVVAVILSHKLGIPLKTDPWNPFKSKYLVVDDINDSGRTLFPHTREPNAHTVVLTTRSTSKIQSTYSGDTIEDDEWVYFPWENKDKVFEDQIAYIESRMDNAIH